MHISISPEYMIWWRISDGDHELMKACECLMKLITHSSLLKTDDVRLKGQTIAARFCDRCEHASMDDVRHLVLQCPSLQDARNAMFRELSEVDNGRSHVILASPGDTLYLLLGKIADGFSIEVMVSFWTVAARHIASMYYEKIMKGIG